MTSSLFGGTGAATGMNAGKPISSGKMPKAPNGFQRFQQFTPEQMQLFQQLFGNVGPDSFTSRLAGGDQSAFEDIERPALQQFAGLQGQTASRFSAGGGGPGALSGRRSSGFQNAMTQGASQFADQLSSQRMGLQRQALQDLFGMSNDLLGQRPYGMVEKPMSFGQSVAGGLSGGIGLGIGKSLFGGLFG